MLALADIVDRDVILLTPDMAVGDAARLLERHRLEAAPVVFKSKVLGIVSLSALRNQNGNHPSRIGDIRFGQYHALPPDTELSEALAYSRYVGADHVLVLDQGQLVGLVSRTRIQSALPSADHGKNGASHYPVTPDPLVPLDHGQLESTLALEVEGAHV